MPSVKISVLMSVYNETEEQIREVFDSLSNQTFKDFEIVVIVDNPNRHDVGLILDEYKDLNIVLYHNPQNIGLAMSMNKAAELAHSNIYARMDADDICEPQRFEKQYEAIKDKEFDLVFSRYSYIDMESKLIEKDIVEYLQPEQLRDNPTVVVSHIHHPTVMFSREIFERTGGYRDFPCSQDLDLWLRMCEANCRFLMLPDVLLKYRINTKSTSSRKWFQQQITCDYMWELAFERLRKGHDTFSQQNYHVYLGKMGNGNKNDEEKLRNAYTYLQKAQEERKKGRILHFAFLKLKAVATSPVLRRRALQQIKMKLYKLVDSFSC